MNSARQVRARGGTVAFMGGKDEAAEAEVFTQALGMDPSVADVVVGVVASIAMEGPDGPACVAFTEAGCDRNFGKDVRICSSCAAKKKMNRCAGCKLAFYCDSNCQRAHWGTHSAYCRTITKIHDESIKTIGMDARQAIKTLTAAMATATAANAR